ncbi:hypothetical protein GTR04_0653 [Trichophyton interdigitale]|uniref:Uncharacterized protein n=2 Tax=Trichophyton interdigitale TaxID=101480 RepID=A0A9P4YHC8_9EURO|nr:hypothetical protein GY632_3622 [Trichophyton interdigitale]KAF3897884.1 hypothetical protein GY631_1349 [Trichophyton interdigitale]KAG8212028.1 hypothetical protein GTR04_0653 [Trichophyton interdigitale]KDB23215.1 hypothetical protein H109_04909 [Trichophyton interdigitale MR816]
MTLGAAYGGSTGAMTGAGVDGGWRMPNKRFGPPCCRCTSVCRQHGGPLAQAAREDWSVCGGAKWIASRHLQPISSDLTFCQLAKEDAKRLIQGRTTYPIMCSRTDSFSNR